MSSPPPVARDVVLLCFPPEDAVFAEMARRSVEGIEKPDPVDLERVLRQAYPAASVRERDVLASFGRPAWYIYRDGRYSPFVNDRWWEAPDTARILLGDDGRYLEANAAALELLQVDLGALRASPPGSFTAPTPQPAVAWILQLLFDSGELHSTSMLRPAGGAPDVPIEYRIVKDGDGRGRHVATIRPVPAAAVEVRRVQELALEGDGA
jgi:hypothetical protein